MDGLRPGKVFFTVTTTGEIENIKVVQTSGYDSLDEKMVDVIKSLPSNWTSAKDANGTPVDQELVVSFGKMGC